MLKLKFHFHNLYILHDLKINKNQLNFIMLYYLNFHKNIKDMIIIIYQLKLKDISFLINNFIIKMDLILLYQFHHILHLYYLHKYYFN